MHCIRKVIFLETILHVEEEAAGSFQYSARFGKRQSTITEGHHAQLTDNDIEGGISLSPFDSALRAVGRRDCEHRFAEVTRYDAGHWQHFR
jgi:hypothetical protein